jgi:hypothetical protein
MNRRLFLTGGAAMLNDFLTYEHWIWSIGGQLCIAIVWLISFPLWLIVVGRRYKPESPSIKIQDIIRALHR